MPQVCWTANACGEYWIDLDLGGHPIQVLIDTGLIDSRGHVGFAVDESLYDKIKQAGGFQNHQLHSRLTAGQSPFLQILPTTSCSHFGSSRLE